MLSKVGFFHFGRDHDKPIPSLRSALECRARCEVSGSLIVLPERFNLGKRYRDRNRPCSWDLVVVEDLQELASSFGVVFVAGLIVDDGSGVCPPYNSARLVDATSSIPMCYKRGSDETAGSNYTPCEAGCVGSNPVPYKNVCVGALICMDVQESGYPLLCALGRRRASRVMCIPSCANRTYFGGGHIDCQVSYADQTSVTTVLANADPNGCNSFITDTQGKIVKIQTSPHENEVALLPLPAS